MEGVSHGTLALNAVWIGVVSGNRTDQAMFAIAGGRLISRRASRNVKIVDHARGDVVDEAYG